MIRDSVTGTLVNGLILWRMLKSAHLAVPNVAVCIFFDKYEMMQYSKCKMG